MKQKLLSTILLTVLLTSASCVTHESIPPAPGNIQALIQPGDKVRVVTKDNEETEFVVVEVTDEAIVGENEKILFADIEEVEEVKTSNLIKVAFIAVLLAVVVAAALLTSASSSSSLLGDNWNQ